MARVHIGSGDRFDDGFGEFTNGEDLTVPALEPLIFFRRDHHRAVAAITGDDHGLGEG